jgi:hypothetical protein
VKALLFNPIVQSLSRECTWSLARPSLGLDGSCLLLGGGLLLHKLLVDLGTLVLFVTLLPVLLLRMVLTRVLLSHVGLALEVVEGGRLAELDVGLHLSVVLEAVLLRLEGHGLGSHVLVGVEPSKGHDVGKRRDLDHGLHGREVRRAN